MSKGDKLSKKQKGFVKDYIKTGNATEAAERNYNVKNRNVANNIGAENLAKPSIVKEIMSIAESFKDEDVVAIHKQLLNSLNLEKLSFNEKDTNEEIKLVIDNMPGYELLYIKEGLNADGAVISKYAYVKAPDNMTRDKALDKVYRLKGIYAADKTDITSKGEKIIIMPSELMKKNENNLQ